LSQHHKTTIIIVRMGSGVTWEKEEDEALSRAWVAASEDAITGTDQKASKFWSRVFEIYVELIPDGKDRTSTACTARWGTINQDVTKFCGLYSQVTSIAKSGWTDDNYLEEARELFKLEGKGRKMGREFLFEGCWRILKDAPKWKGGCGHVRDQQQIAKKCPELLDVRPMGTKAAKDSKLLANAQLVIEQKHVQMLERKVKTQRDEFLFKIFSLNINSEEAKRWFAMKAQEAMEEMEDSSKPSRKKTKTGSLESGSSVEIDISTSRSSSTDDEVSILETGP
jgi:hypothetical protein